MAELKIPNYLKNIGIALVVFLIFFNILSIFNFMSTVASWGDYFKASLYGSAGVLMLMGLVLVVLRKRIKAHYIIVGCIMSFVYYNLCAGFIPFYINTFGDSEVVTIIPSRVTINDDFTVVYAEDDWQTEIVSGEHYDYSFEYKNYTFSKSGNEEYGQQLEFDCKVGLFGWEYIDEIRLK